MYIHPSVIAERKKLQRSKNTVLYISTFFKYYLVAWCLMTSYLLHKTDNNNSNKVAVVVNNK
jgi:hypothetical protein